MLRIFYLFIRKPDRYIVHVNAHTYIQYVHNQGRKTKKWGGAGARVVKSTSLNFWPLLNKGLLYLALIEVKLPYDPVCPSVGPPVVCHNFKFHFPCLYRSILFTCDNMKLSAPRSDSRLPAVISDKRTHEQTYIHKYERTE